VELQRRVGNRQGEALALATQGYAHLRSGAVGAARASLEESAELARELGYLHGLMFSLNGLGAVLVQEGDLDGAAESFGAAQELRESLRIEHDPDDALVGAERAAVQAASFELSSPLRTA
jgi:Flp pilus assembly protein TadD